VLTVAEEVGFVGEGDVSYLYLPLAHAFALMVQLATFAVGSSIVYFGGDTKQIVAELAQAKPTFLPSLPRIFEKIYALATAAAEDQAALRQAIELGARVRRMQHRGEAVPAHLRDAFGQADEALYRNVRRLFGGKVQQAVSGAAPIAAGDSRVLLCVRRAGAGGLGDDRDDRRQLREHPGSAPVRNRGPAPSWRGDQGRRRRRAPDQGAERVSRVLAQP
jgi:long-subunit acyl-CoA synthetase (AMP-forming)